MNVDAEHARGAFPDARRAADTEPLEDVRAAITDAERGCGTGEDATEALMATVRCNGRGLGDPVTRILRTLLDAGEDDPGPDPGPVHAGLDLEEVETRVGRGTRIRSGSYLPASSSVRRMRVTGSPVPSVQRTVAVNAWLIFSCPTAALRVGDRGPPSSSGSVSAAQHAWGMHHDMLAWLS